MNRLEHIEHCQGVGQLCRERTLRFQVGYDLDIYQEREESAPHAGLRPVQQQIKGAVSGLGESDLWYLQHQRLTLILSDGREFDLELGLKGEVVSPSAPHEPG